MKQSILLGLLFAGTAIGSYIFTSGDHRLGLSWILISSAIYWPFIFKDSKKAS